MLIKHIALIRAFVAQFLKARMSYRIDFFVSLGANLFTTALSFVFIVVIFQSIPDLDSWSFEEVLFIYGFALIPVGIFNIVSINFWGFGDKYIIEGGFDRILLRPLYPLYQILFESFRIESLQDIAIGSFIVWYASQRMGLAIGWFEMLAFLFFGICGACLLIGFFSLLTSINFWFEDRIGIGAPIYNMMQLARYPITLYSNLLKIVLCTIVPFAYMSFFPSTHFLDRGEFRTFVYLVPVVTLLFTWITALAWRAGMRRYGSTGS